MKPFDAIVGRLVLEFLPDPAAAISRLSGLLRPGGIMAFQEPSWKIWLTLHVAPAAAGGGHDAGSRHVCRRGREHRNGTAALQGFKAANLTSPQLRVDLPIGDSPEFRDLLYDLLLAVWPRAEALQLPLEELGDPETLASRLNDELDANKSFASFVGLVGAFARKREE